MPNLRLKSAANRTWCFLVFLQFKSQAGSQQSRTVKVTDIRSANDDPLKAGTVKVTDIRSANDDPLSLPVLFEMAFIEKLTRIVNKIADDAQPDYTWLSISPTEGGHGDSLISTYREFLIKEIVANNQNAKVANNENADQKDVSEISSEVTSVSDACSAYQKYLKKLISNIEDEGAQDYTWKKIPDGKEVLAHCEQYFESQQKFSTPFQKGIETETNPVDFKETVDNGKVENLNHLEVDEVEVVFGKNPGPPCCIIA